MTRDDFSLKDVSNVFDDRMVLPNRPAAEFVGSTRVYSKRYGGVFYADDQCPHLPSGALEVTPINWARDRMFFRPCSHCTI